MQEGGVTLVGWEVGLDWSLSETLPIPLKDSRSAPIERSRACVSLYDESLGGGTGNDYVAGSWIEI